LPAHQLERLCDGDYGVDAGRNRKRFDLMTPAPAADRSHNGALGPAGNMGSESSFPDALDHMFNLFGCRGVGHIHNHGKNPFGCNLNANAAIGDRGVECGTFELPLLS